MKGIEKFLTENVPWYNTDFFIPVNFGVHPIMYDATLREGFQTPGGIGGSLEERMYAAALIQNYADWVELGMPANNVDFKIIKAIKDRFKKEDYQAGIAVLARCHPLDIERAAEVMEDYHTSLIHLFIGTSPEHRSVRFGGKLSDEEYEAMIENSAANASSRKVFSRVMFSPEDAYRTFKEDRIGFTKFLLAAIKGYENGNANVGRKAPLVINLPDTVGYSTIEEFNQMIEYVQRVFGGKIEISVHHHDDSKMATAATINSFEKYRVPWLQTTFGQLGERNGIAPTDLVLKILNERGYIQNERIINPENLQELDKVTRAVLWVLGRQVPEEHLKRPNTTTAGIHSDLVIKAAQTYHIFGDGYGSKVYVELGPTSGSRQVMDVLDSFGVKYDKSSIGLFTDKLKETANNRKSPLSITHILYEAHLYFNGNNDDGLIVRDYREQTTDDGKTILTIKGTIDKKPFNKIQIANGPVEAAMEALNDVINEHKIINEEISLEDYGLRVIPVLSDEYLRWEIKSKPKIPEQVGKNAHLAIALVFKNGSGQTYEGWARHENSTKAEIDAVIDGITKMYALQKWNEGN